MIFSDLVANADTYTTLMGGNYEMIALNRASESSSQEFVIRAISEYFLDVLNTFNTTLRPKVVKADGSEI